MSIERVTAARASERGTALHFAALFGYDDVVLFLLERGADYSLAGNWAERDGTARDGRAAIAS